MGIGLYRIGILAILRGVWPPVRSWYSAPKGSGEHDQRKLITVFVNESCLKLLDGVYLYQVWPLQLERVYSSILRRLR